MYGWWGRTERDDGGGVWKRSVEFRGRVEEEVMNCFGEDADGEGLNVRGGQRGKEVSR